MSEGGQDFTLHRGRDRSLVYVIHDQDGGTVDHSGVTATWIASTGIGHPTLVSKTNGAGAVVDQDPVDQTLRVTVTLDDTDTKDLDPGRYLTELGIENAAGEYYVVAQGTMSIQATNLAPEAA